jgi:GntR family transcriptional regulator
MVSASSATQGPGSLPLHQFVAESLSKRIIDGEWAVGEALPSESDFCRFYGVSRHTLRHALDALEEKGMILRRQGAPTRVTSRQQPRRFTHSPNSPGDILRFAHGTYRVNEVEEYVECDADLSQLLRTPVGTPWFHIGALRREYGSNVIVAWMDTYILPKYADITKQTRYADLLVYQQIEQDYGVQIDSGEVNIYAKPASPRIAKALQVPSGSACLAIERRCVDAQGETYLVATANHPGNRFIYSMEYRTEY